MTEVKSRVSWEDRAQALYEHHPWLADVDWQSALSDVDVLGRVVKDLLRSDAAESAPKRFGPRPNPTEVEMASRLRQFMGEDYTELRFREATLALMRERGVSIRMLAEGTGIPKTVLHRMLAGGRQPDMGSMRSVASYFRRQPSFFFEYRMLGFVAALIIKLERHPETLTHLYQGLMRDMANG